MPVTHSTEDLSGRSPADAAICFICNDELGNSRPLAVTHCSHTFHKTCVLTWLGAKPVCPTCQQPCLYSQISFPDESAETLLTNQPTSIEVPSTPHELKQDSINQSNGTKPKPKGSRGKPSFSRPITRSKMGEITY